MRKVLVIYRVEQDGWWAEAPDFPGYTAVGKDYNEVRQLVHEGLPDFTGDDLEFLEIVTPSPMSRPSTFSYSLGFRLTKSFQSPVSDDPMDRPATGTLVAQG